ncbi:MAG: NAD(P)H-binding protein, partial [Pirellulales bacterium]|nr:NAD(P)H-binding protein [Pirellulales bacterium]
MSQQPILVLGATGKTGRRIVERLSANGYAVRKGSRRADPSFDWDKPETWAAALQDVEAVYISFFPDLAVPGAPAAIKEFTSRAVKAGVKRLVLLSGRGEEEAQRCEDIVGESGVSFTLIRASWFSQNFSESFLLDAVRSGTVALPVGDVGEPFVDADDIAEVAVAALTEDGHDGRLYEVTGPRLLTFKDAVGMVAAAADRPVRFVSITPEQYEEGLAQSDVPKEFASLLMYLFTTILDGRN